MTRALFRCLLWLLLMATLVWGGGVSCPQFFQNPAGSGDPHGCCQKPASGSSHHSKPAKDCVIQPLDIPAPVAETGQSGAAFEFSPPPDSSGGHEIAAARLPGSTSPPDRLALLHTFLI